MAVEPYNYDLPEERIAQRPVMPYDAARLLIGESSSIRESTFADFDQLLKPGDLLIFNNTRVFPARLRGEREGTGSAVELLLLQEHSAGVWRALGKPLKRLKPGTVVHFGSELTGTIGERCSSKEILVSFQQRNTGEELSQVMRRVGIMPIPPYIRGGMGDEADRADYQPLLARHEGSVAAPTASLHFTPEVMRAIGARGVKIEEVTLHLGTASFLPLWEKGDSVASLQPPAGERMIPSRRLVEAIRATRSSGGRVVAIGTSAMRATESMVRLDPLMLDSAEPMETELFIQPGFEFQAVDVLVTNFHQPRTTHLLLVEAFIGRLMLERTYAYGLENGFRFLSYGDGMWLVPS